MEAIKNKMNKRDLKKILKEHLLKEVTFESWFKNPQKETFCRFENDILVETGKDLFFGLDFSKKRERSAVSDSKNCTYMDRQSCINLLLKFLDCKIKESEIKDAYLNFN